MIVQVNVSTTFSKLKLSVTSYLSVTVTLELLTAGSLTGPEKDDRRTEEEKIKKTEQNEWDASELLPGGSYSAMARVCCSLRSESVLTHFLSIIPVLCLSVCVCLSGAFKGRWRVKDRGRFLL